MSENEILEVLNSFKTQNQGLYDFIACDYYKLSKEQLKDMLLEVLANIGNDEYKKCLYELPKWLVEYKGWEVNKND